MAKIFNGVQDKINAFLLRVFSIFSFGETKDAAYRDYNRRWAWAPAIGWDRTSIWFGWFLYLVQFQGEKTDRPIQDVTFQLRPELKIRSEHIYYDGPHCFYQFGPFAFSTSLVWCKKCRDEA